MPTSNRRRELADAARDRRAALGEKRKCLNGAHHGAATNGRRCAWCAFVNVRGLSTAIILEAQGKAPPRPPEYKPRPRGEPRGAESLDRFGTATLGIEHMRAQIGTSPVTGQIDASAWFLMVPWQYRATVMECAMDMLVRYRGEVLRDETIAAFIEDMNREIGSRVTVTATIRIVRPDSAYGGWQIRARRGGRVACLGRIGELRDVIQEWRIERATGEIDRKLEP